MYGKPYKISKIADNVLPFLLIAVLYFSWSTSVSAQGGLTDIFYTKSFQGSWEVVNKYNWLGGIIQFIFTSFCFLGLVMVAYQRFISILYLGGRNTFDTIHEYKQADKGQGWLGMKNMGMEVFKGSRGTGMDAIIGLGYSLMPDVKEYSDFNENKLANLNLKEEDSATTYILKTAIPTIMLVFFFSMGFNGTLMKGYGMIANGLGAVADKAVDSNLEGWITNKLNTGDSYRFTLAESGSAVGKFGEKIASDLYGKVLSRFDVLDTETRMAVGLAVEKHVYEKILASSVDTSAYKQLATLAKKDIVNTDPITVSSEEDVAALSYTIVVNTNPVATGGTSVLMTSFVGRASAQNDTAKKLYAHIIIRKGRVSASDYFVVPGSTSTTPPTK